MTNLWPDLAEQLQTINSRLETIERKAFKELFDDHLPSYDADKQQAEIIYLRDKLQRVRYFAEEITKCLLFT